MKQRDMSARALLEGLQHVRHERIDSFISYCHKYEMDPLWHARRCQSFGASEIGALIRHADKGSPLVSGSFFSTAQDVVATKQLERFPFPGTIYTDRGHEMEPALRYTTRKIYNAQVDYDGLKAIEQANLTDTKLPYLRVSPDDLLIINGKRYVPDYKMPTDASGDVEEDYGWQLHAYKLAAFEKAGIEVDGVLLVRGVLPADTGLEFASWLKQGKVAGPEEYAKRIATVSGMLRSEAPGFGLKIDKLVYDLDKGQRIKEVCEHYWHDYVLKGLQPDCGPTEPLALPEVEKTRIKRLEDELATVLAAAGVLDKKQKGIKSELQEILASAPGGVTDQTIFPSSLVKPSVVRKINWDGVMAELDRSGVETDGAITSDNTFNVEALVEKLVDLGVDVSDPSLRATSLDTKHLAKLVETHGIDISKHVSYEPRFGLGRDKASKEEAVTMASQFEEKFSDWSAEKLGSDESDDVQPPVQTLKFG